MIKNSTSKKKKYRITNWREYNKALRTRGSLTFWFSEDFEKGWFATLDDKHQRGRPFTYSNTCITLILTLRHVFKFALRQLTGFVESLLTLMGKSLPVPEFSRLSKRATDPLSCMCLSSLKEGGHIVIDSSGLKVFGEREWLETKYGKQYQRKVWRKLHIGINDQSEIIAKELTDHLTDDRFYVNSLLHQAGIEHIDELLADGGYDSHKVYQISKTHQIKLVIPPPTHAVISYDSNPTLRDQTISYIKNKGYWAWYHKNDYGRRNKVENTFYRLKTIFGRKLHSRNWKNQQAEAHLICCLLNKMTQAGMPKSVKVA